MMENSYSPSCGRANCMLRQTATFPPWDGTLNSPSKGGETSAPSSVRQTILKECCPDSPRVPVIRTTSAPRKTAGLLGGTLISVIPPRNTLKVPSGCPVAASQRSNTAFTCPPRSFVSNVYYTNAAWAQTRFGPCVLCPWNPSRQPVCCRARTCRPQASPSYSDVGVRRSTSSRSRSSSCYRCQAPPRASRPRGPRPSRRASWPPGRRTGRRCGPCPRPRRPGRWPCRPW